MVRLKKENYPPQHINFIEIKDENKIGAVASCDNDGKFIEWPVTSLHERVYTPAAGQTVFLNSSPHTLSSLIV